MDKPGISVIIPNYNGLQLLPQIIPPLLHVLVNAGVEYEIIVSDDCSTDESVKYLKANFPEIIILENKVNSGFSPTINKGIFLAKLPLLMLLNSDVKLEPGYFNPLFHYFENKDCFGVMGRIIGWNDDVIQDAAKYPGFHGAKIKTTGNYFPLEIKNDDMLLSMYLSGANALVSREKILELKGFDELFAPFYIEDYELSLRAWRLGWTCYYEHTAICRHKLSSSIKSKSRKAAVQTIYYRNKMILHAIHLSGNKLIFWYLQLVPETLIRIFSGRFYYVKSLIAFFRSSKKIKASKEKFKELGKHKQALLSIEAVMKKIKDSLSDRAIRHF
ncbi:MAG: glycosyltransferase [Ferruginibacter sp.]